MTKKKKCILGRQKDHAAPATGIIWKYLPITSRYLKLW